jgi:hypothetical protein
MKRALVAALLAACNPSSRAGSGGAAVSSEPAPSTMPAPIVAPSTPVATGMPAPPVPSATAAPPAARADASAGSPSTLLEQCPQKFSSARYARCKWSTGPFRRCGGALPLDDDGRPREGCVCNECADDRDCNDRGRNGKCLEFPDEACGPPAKGCVYSGDACFTPSKCKAPDRCMHDALGHPSCSLPPAPPM